MSSYGVGTLLRPIEGQSSNTMRFSLEKDHRPLCGRGIFEDQRIVRRSLNDKKLR